MGIPAISRELNYLSDLNPQQREAVEFGDGPLLIFAGAGSGKTRVLTRRVAHLIYAHGASPSSIFAVTFTNKAAREMKERVSALFGSRAMPIWVATFHSSCVRILRSHAKLLDFTDNFAIYDSSDSLSAMKRVYKRLNIDPKIVEPRHVLSVIDRAKNSYKFADSIRNDWFTSAQHRDVVAQLFEGYQEELKNSNAMDFGDLLCNTVTLFKLESNLLEQYQERFRYLLIDEYQDTNHVQYLLIQMLAAKHKNLCVVGDDDQSIYAFRGASVENILSFRKDFPGAKVITLDTNYRSTKNVLTAANAIIVPNKRREPKEMKTDNPAGSKIICFTATDEEEEAKFVVREMITLIGRGTPPSDIAVFYRTNAQSRAIEESLCEAGLPYEIYGGHKFYDRKEIKDILAYFRLLLNPYDNEAFLRVVNNPTRGIGETALSLIIRFADKTRQSLFRAAKDSVSEDDGLEQADLSPAQKKKLKVFVELIETLQQDAERSAKVLATPDAAFSTLELYEAVAVLLRKIAEKSGYIAALRIQDTPEADSRVENIEELYRVAIDFVSRNIEQNVSPTLGDFLDRTALASDLDRTDSNNPNPGQQNNSEENNSPEQRPNKNQGSLSLMTLHLAKGLEYDVVFLVGLEEGILPHVRSLEHQKDLEEERRLCYVGITRAKKLLYLTRASDRQSFGRSTPYSGIPSRFIFDLPTEVLEDRRSGFVPRYRN